MRGVDERHSAWSRILAQVFTSPEVDHATRGHLDVEVDELAGQLLDFRCHAFVSARHREVDECVGIPRTHDGIVRHAALRHFAIR